MSQWFPPEPAVAPKSMADSLVALGHQVDVLTGYPNYPTGRLPDGWRVRPYQRQELSPGLTIHRAPLYPSHDTSPIKRFGNYASFAAGATTVALARLPRPDVWLTYSSPSTAAVPAMLARRGMRAPTAMVIQDLWPDSVSGSGFLPVVASRLIDGVLSPFVAATYRHARAIGVISPGMADVLMARGVPKSRIHYTPNSVDATSLATGQAADLRADLGLGNAKVFLYVGSLGAMQDLAPLIRAFAGLEGVALVIVGDGVERGSLEKLTADVPNVHLRPPVVPSEVGRLVRGADVQVVSLRDTPLLRVTMPSKVQTSLASGRPVLAHATGDVAELIRSSGAGQACTPGNLDDTRRAILGLATLTAEESAVVGARARARYEAEFTLEAAGARLERLLLSALNPAPT